MANWLDDFERWAAPIPTVPLYRRWAGVMAASAAVQRRRWLPTKPGPIFPNLYVVLVSTPGTGKTMAMNGARAVLSYMKEGVAGVLPDSVTRASMLDEMAKHLHTEKNGSGMYVWVGASLMTDELSILLHEYDRDLISHWSKLWDNLPYFEEARRHSDKKLLRLEQPFLTFFAGVQPSVLGNILPEHAWTQGFCSRTLFAFSEEEVPFSMGVFEVDEQSAERRRGAQALAARLESFCDRHEPVGMTPGALALFGQWARDRWQPAPTHEKLADYNTRRWLQALKIGILRATCDGRNQVSERDFMWAKALLEDTETGYHQMFQELRRASDKDIYEDVAQWLLLRHAELEREGRLGVPESEIHRYLQTRTAANKVVSFIQGLQLGGHMTEMIQAGLFGGAGEKLYKPTGRVETTGGLS